MKILLLGLSSIVLLSGCVLNNINDKFHNSMKKYQEPLTGQMAKVRIFYGASNISIYPNSATKKDIRNDKDKGRAISNIKSSGMPGFGKSEYDVKRLDMPFAPTDTNSYGEFKVPAERPIIISMSYAVNNGHTASSCPFKYFKVHFEENKNYLLSLDVNSICLYRIFEYSENGKLVPVKNVEKI